MYTCSQYAYAFVQFTYPNKNFTVMVIRWFVTILHYVEDIVPPFAMYYTIPNTRNGELHIKSLNHSTGLRWLTP